jgi:hypothetical protein
LVIRKIPSREATAIQEAATMTAKYPKNIKSKALDAYIYLTLKGNYYLNNYNEVIWLVGDGRSGTTWVSSLINHQKNYREMFEPFHPRHEGMEFLLPHQYMSDHDANDNLRVVADAVFSGKFMHHRVDSSNRSLLYSGLLIKDIFANLFCFWACRQFPRVRPILLIRNPFSVALSKYKKRKWFWVTEPLDLLRQISLHKDFLMPFEDLIRKTSAKGDYILNQILIWSIIYYVPLLQFKPEEIHICFYESIFTDPDREVSDILQFVRQKPDRIHTKLSKEIINRPSRVIGSDSNIILGTSPVSSWKGELSSRLIDEGLEILDCFGFADLYDTASMPQKDVLKTIHRSA